METWACTFSNSSNWPLVADMLARTPSEISLQWIYFPPFFVTLLVGFLAAVGIVWLLKATGGSRFFWHPGLTFVSLWVLTTSLIGMFFISP